MFDFVRKSTLWSAWDNKLDRELGQTGPYHLKTAQDLAVYSAIRGTKGQVIGEVGGGNSRLLERLSLDNTCFNIDKFDGEHGGPDSQPKIPRVSNIVCYLGEFSPLLETNSFDLVFSISVVEHVPDDGLKSFFEDQLRVLKPGGRFVHAIDMYLEDSPMEYYQQRYAAYRRWIDASVVEPLARIVDGPLAFTCDMASNPDSTMYSWGRISPRLIGLRQTAQSVSLIVGGRKR